MWIFHVRYVSTIECVVFRHVQCPSHLWKFLIFEKVLPREQGLSEGQVFTRTFI